MLWIKRNLSLIIGGLVAIGLTVLAVFYLLSRMALDRDLTQKYKDLADELQRINALEPFPNDENIAVAGKDVTRIQEVVKGIKSLIVATNPPVLNNAQFSSLLAVTISDLQSNAESAGVTLPAKYGFTFTPLREKVQFAPAGLPALTTQVSEIRELCDILFKAKIHVLEGLRRVPVSTDDAGSATDYLENKGVVTNQNLQVTITPYEVTFKGFTAELSAVVEGLQRSPVFFVIKGISVETIEVPAPPPPPPEPPQKTKAGGKSSAPAAPRTDLTLLLDEKPLRIKMSLEVVKPILRPAPVKK